MAQIPIKSEVLNTSTLSKLRINNQIIIKNNEMEITEEKLKERIEELRASRDASYNKYYIDECDEKIDFLLKLKDALFGS